MNLRSYLSFFWTYVKLNVATAMEYRVNFFAQVIGMFLNDVVWVVFWLIFFKKFGVVNSWSYTDMLMLYAVLTTSFGLSGVLFGNRREIAKIIAEGKLDFYLALPRNELVHILISRSNFTDFGDLLFGITIACFAVSLETLPLFIVLILFATLIITHFGILIGSLAYYMGNAEELSFYGQISMIALASYPITIFTGATKFILLTILPAGFITGIPVELMRNFSWLLFGKMALFTVVFCSIAWLVFYKGLKRYESGNLINVRM